MFAVDVQLVRALHARKPSAVCSFRRSFAAGPSLSTCLHACVCMHACRCVCVWGLGIIIAVLAQDVGLQASCVALVRARVQYASSFVNMYPGMTAHIEVGMFAFAPSSMGVCVYMRVSPKLLFFAELECAAHTSSDEPGFTSATGLSRLRSWRHPPCIGRRTSSWHICVGLRLRRAEPVVHWGPGSRTNLPEVVILMGMPSENIRSELRSGVDPSAE